MSNPQPIRLTARGHAQPTTCGQYTTPAGLVLVLLVAFSVSCRPQAVATRPTAPRLMRWILAPQADDADQFCIPSPLGADIDPSDAYPLRCVPVGEIRRWVRGQRAAN